MDHLMLLGGQFLQARIRNEFLEDRVSAATRSREFWEGADVVGRGVHAYSLAVRLMVGLVVLGVVFAALSVAAPSESGAPPMACLACSAALP